MGLAIWIVAGFIYLCIGMGIHMAACDTPPRTRPTVPALFIFAVLWPLIFGSGLVAVLLNKIR